MAEQIIRVGDLPGMRAFFDAVTGLVEAVNTADVPESVRAAADRVRAETLGIGDTAATVDGGDRIPARLDNEDRLRTAMRIARENPLREVTVNWVPEHGNPPPD